MDENLNSTELEAQSGEQAGAVAQQTQTQSPTAAAGAGQERVVDAPSSRNPDFDYVDVGEDGEGDAAKPSQPGGAGRAEAKSEQTREENAAIRAARLRAQREAEAAATARAATRADAEIASMTGLINPYTDKPFSSMAELRAYNDRMTQAAIAKRAQETGQSVAELSEDAANRQFITDLRRQVERDTAMAQAAQREATAQRAFIENDVLAFMEKHPEMDLDGLSALENNPTFRKFCGTRFGREPLSDLYDAYQSLIGDAGRVAVSKAASRSARSTGGGTTGGATLSPEQKKALDRWNEENPEMRMTPQEFLRR